MKTFALGSALLSPDLFARLAQAEPASTASPAGAVTGAAGAGVTIRQMMVQPLSIPGKRMAAVVTVEYAPSASSPPHRHPGPVFGYVLEGRVQIALDQKPPVTYSAGDAWYEEPRVLHRVSGNPSATEPAKILAFLIVEKGQPLVVPVKERA